MRLVRVRQQNKRKSRHLRIRYLLIAILLALSALTANAFRPIPVANISLDLPASAKAQNPVLSWPTTGQAAIATTDYGMLATYGEQKPIATASIAKVITALCVLQKYPLSVGQSGPTLTFSKQDVALYEYQLAHNGSNVAVYEGSQMTEYEALEALLLPSANNIADSLAIWAFGDLDSYASYANNYVLQHGLVMTHIGVDASGFDPSTVSTATDLATLGLLAETEPVIMSIASLKSAVLPNVGTVYNYNSALGSNGITGLKTGNNDQNKGALLFTAKVQVAGKSIGISGAILGQDSLESAMTASSNLVGSVGPNFEDYTYVNKGQVIGTAKTAWGTSVPIVAKKTAQLLRWKGDGVTVKQTIHATAADKPATIGALDVVAGAVQTSLTVTLSNTASGPSYWWRATRL